MESARLNAPFDFPATESELEKLLPSKNVVLLSSEPPGGTRSFVPPALAGRLVNLPPHTVEKSPTVDDSPPTQPVFDARCGLDHAQAAAYAQGLPGYVAGVIAREEGGGCRYLLGLA